MATIRPLPSSVVNKIAAGEVIERPASVVKELLENAVDAGSTRIDVAIEKGGSELIRVSDNGKGIAADELPLAVTNHATSKIESADDLFRVGTLGFRGEALASISEVSQFVLRSRQAEAAAGAELLVHGGVARPIEPAGCPVGTTVEVRQLFFNTPVRQKFLRTPQTEIGHATEAFSRIALANPQVTFTLSHNGRLIHELPAAPDTEAADDTNLAAWRERISKLFGQDIAESLMEVHSEEGGVRLSGFVANPEQSRANNRLQYLLLNGRAIRDRSLQHALSESYRGLLLTGRYPICFLRLDMPADMVDVNVHPTKLEVRFQDGGRHYSQLLGTIRTKFLTSDLKPGARESSGAEDEVSESADQPSRLVDWAKGELTQRRFDGPTAGGPPSGNAAHARPGTPLSMHYLPAGTPIEPGSGTAVPSFQKYDDAAGRTSPQGMAASSAMLASAGTIPIATSPSTTGQPTTGTHKAIQLHNRYLIVETAEGMEVIDQHALHERILYEQIREKVLGGGLEFQKLLTPEPVDLTPAEAAITLENAALLKSLGVEVQPFGGDTVLVASYPAMLADCDRSEVLRSLIEALLAGGKAPEARDLLDSLLHTISCKAAVKYGDRLTPEEVQALLDLRPLTENHHHCPHGRPTALVFTSEELDKRFKRI